MTKRDDINRWFLEEVTRLQKEWRKSYDTEGTHQEADELLLKMLERLGYSECAELWRAFSKHFWYC